LIFHENVFLAFCIEMFAFAMEDCDTVLSDVTAGLFLLSDDHEKILKRNQLRIKAEEGENPEDNRILRPRPDHSSTFETIVQAEPISNKKTKIKPQLSLKSSIEQGEDDEWTSIYFLEHYSKYAVASYTVPILCLVEGSSVCRWCTRMNCCCCIP